MYGLILGFLVPIVLPIVAIVMVSRLKSRVNQLEADVQRYKAQKPASAEIPREAVGIKHETWAAGAPHPEKAGSSAVPAQKKFQSFNEAPEYVAKDIQETNGFINWLKDDWLLKLGALLLLIGFGWFVSYAFLNNWIGPVGRISLGLLGGAAILAVGWWRIKSFINQGGILIMLGSTTILITIYAAREIYGFFTPVTALVMMFLAAATVAMASVKYNSKPLALGSLILAGLSPQLTASPMSEISIFSYLLVVVLGAIWIVVITGWRELTMAALILVGMYSMPHIERFAEQGTLLLFAYAFAAIFFITNTSGILKNKDGNVKSDVFAAVLNGLFLLGWIVSSAPEEWKSIIISIWMVAFLLAAFAIFKMTGQKNPFYIYSGVGAGMLAAATAVELSGAALTIAYTVESAIVALVVYLIVKDIEVADNFSLLQIGPVILSFSSIASPAWNSGVFHEDFFVLFVLSFILLGSGIFSFLQRKIIGLPSSGITKALIIGGSIFAYILIWLSLHAAFYSQDAATMTSLVIYTVIGFMCYFYGKTKDKKIFLVYGSAVMGAVVLRLLFVDVWNMELSGRIITFFLVGGLLIGTAFIGRKKKI